MKANTIIAALMMGMAVMACNNAKPAAEGEDAALQVKTAADFTPSKAEVDSVSYLVGINFGSFIKGYNFGELNYSEIMKGLKDFVNAEGDQMSPEFVNQFKHDPNTMNQAFNAYLEKIHNRQAFENRAASEAFLEKNAKREGVQETPSRLQYEIIEPGNPDLKAGPMDQVSVLYKGTLIDGTVFDQTPEGSEPITLALNQVIPGWTEGLQLVGEGGHIKLYIPSDLAYGEQGGGQVIGPNAALIFDVKVAKVIKSEVAE